MKRTNNKNILLFTFFLISLVIMFANSIIVIIISALAGMIFIAYKYYSKSIGNLFNTNKKIPLKKLNKDISFFDDYSIDD